MSGITDNSRLWALVTERQRALPPAEERVMTRYYFDIRDGQDLYPDEEGLELADQKAAEIEAARALGD
ncbi:hypothetical protein XH79_38030, partial [Bradyrhizobium sp. CCBAU 45389]|nr:hypothetical protein [Bradyrhizobium sp. CCBAU 45389]